jgi:lantibiotic modifying enzyme
VPPAQGAHHGGWPHLGYYNGLYQGTSGILCFLRDAASCGFAVHTKEPLVRRGLTYLSTQSLNTINHNAPGLFTGSAGFAIGLCSAFHSGPIYQESYDHEAIRFCLERETTAGDILTGAAGQGMAVLHCTPFLEETFVRTKLRENVALLLETQQKDGSWFRDGIRRGKRSYGVRDRSYGVRDWERIYGFGIRDRNYGFGRGIAGICYFLLEYGNRHHDAAPVQAAVRGLNYLVRVSVKSSLGGGYQWTAGSVERKRGAGWSDGTPGIALAFLKAYEHLGTPGYRRIAEETLRTIPVRYTSPNLSLYNGLSGLGEIYL